MAIYITRTGTFTAKQTNTPMTTQGSSTAPGGFTVPTGVTNLVALISTICAIYTGTVGTLVVFLRISGQGVGGGEQDISIGGTQGGLTTSGFAASVQNALYIPTQIPVIAGSGIQINVDSDTGGTAPARTDVCVTMVFQ